MSTRPEPKNWPPPGWQHRRWRVGRQVGRAVILQQGDEPAEDDPTIGQMDTSELGHLVADAVNFYRDAHGGVLPSRRPTAVRVAG